MKTRYKILIIGIIIVLSISSFFLYDYLTEHRGMIYPGTGSRMVQVESKLCRQLSGNVTFGNCFGINDICKDVYGILKYDKKRSEVGCNLHNRVDLNCSKLQLATGWIKQSELICYLPFDKELMKSREVWYAGENEN